MQLSVSHMTLPNLSHVDHWIFDLDNVLYPSECDLFALIDIKMGEYIAQTLDCDYDEARKVQKAFFHDHGNLEGQFSMIVELFLRTKGDFPCSWKNSTS